ncbi:muscular LMNA-interacting protein isoform X1, partial [Lates japonicus]
MDSLNKSLEKVSIGAPPKPSFFTFVPVVHKLPFKSIITEEGERSGAGKPNKIVAVSHEKTSKETMSDGEIFKAELVFIKDSVGGGAGNVIKPETEHQPSSDHMSLSHTKASPSVSAQSENTPNHVATRTASMETAAEKHRGISQRQCHDTSGRTEVSSGCFANRVCVSEDRTSPTNSADLFPTLASSRESILSEGLDKDKSWSATQLSSVTSPFSLSRTVSPCSSVRSGIFTPTVTQIKRHFLAPGSSLVHIPQSCFSSCESLSSSVCPQSSPPRHRPPLTRLSLLTAILRKGRLPVLFPGWPSPTSSPTPTPSPAPPIRDLTPSPSLSLRSTTPSPRPGSGISDCSDREGKKRKTHKIKLSYKSLAAIPTNTLLLDQQAIDEQVEREDRPCDTLDRGVTLDRGDTDTHAEMCSPAQLRQQSEELYAVIDEILANSIPAPSRSSTTNVGVQRSNSPFSKSLGRETKYASLCSLHPSAGVERKLMDPRKTKPGVIRPMTAIPRLTVEDEEEFHPNPFRQSVIKQTLTDNKKVENMSPEEAGKDLCTSSK